MLSPYHIANIHLIYNAWHKQQKRSCNTKCIFLMSPQGCISLSSLLVYDIHIRFYKYEFGRWNMRVDRQTEMTHIRITFIDFVKREVLNCLDLHPKKLAAWRSRNRDIRLQRKMVRPELQQDWKGVICTGKHTIYRWVLCIFAFWMLLAETGNYSKLYTYRTIMQ
jgi:hypothetical protein